ncbi:VOC family protein [Streptomyces sp. PSKA54]|uniref:VOC family protein n=1 Tax=Streptomyces himalayensis subsp. aureolus TaxID=2758039 RepID=A0A7W2HIJ2_9ACTN|nr:VOC family protein [Streptomyces himalayensis]MBA4865110.1 VOC family protein [Streptomyces himalayensis subsp. aureolus]
MLTTRYVTGSPNWIDVGTRDIEGAKAFYGGLFGWEFRSAGPEAGGYGMFQLNGKTVAGGMAISEEQGSPSWTLYFQSPHVDATAKAVEQSGGAVLMEPMDVFDVGRMAIFGDPAGIGFGCWQPGTNKGLDLVGDQGTLCWTELYTPDVAAATEFYGSVFGWETFDVPFPGGRYTTVNPAGTGEQGMFGGVVPLDSDPVETEAGAYWLPYFEVADTDASAAKARELGGTVRTEPTDMETVGRLAKLTDPYGARFAVIKSTHAQG